MVPFLSVIMSAMAASETPAADAAEPAAEPAAESAANAAPVPLLPGDLDLDQAITLAQTYGIEALKVLVILVVAWLIAGWCGRATSRGLRKARVEETLALFFGKIARWGILILAVLACLQRFGVNTTSFAAVIAAAGFAIGLAFQGTLSNFSAGVMLLIFRPFKVEDFIEVSGETGTVREIDLFTTEIDTVDNRRIVIPNSRIFGEVIKNYNHNPERRVDILVGVHYKEDIDQTREVLMNAAKTVANRIEARAIDIILAELNASSVDWKVRIWTQPANYWQVREDALVACKKALDAAGLVIPYPQMDVHLDKLDA
ncbi:MAG: mechanosensitive ion channel [Planctomycetota bacterium]|jgi:small conductance mechanosensitive channel|nr:mechanosensitive ion channel [Planctomycetota bacterium]